MITTVVFDLDDTLYDEIEYCKSGFTAVAEFLANLGKAPAAERIFATFWEQFTGGKLDWDAESMRFTNNDEANEYVKASYRSGWTL